MARKEAEHVSSQSRCSRHPFAFCFIFVPGEVIHFLSISFHVLNVIFIACYDVLLGGVLISREEEKARNW